MNLCSTLGIPAVLAAALWQCVALAGEATLDDYWNENARWKLIHKYTDDPANELKEDHINMSGSHIEIVDGVWYLFSRRLYKEDCLNNDQEVFSTAKFGTQVRRSKDQGVTWSKPQDLIELESFWSCGATDGDAFYDADSKIWHYLFQCLDHDNVWRGCHLEFEVDAAGRFTRISNASKNPVIETIPAATPGDANQYSPKSLWNKICDKYPQDDCARIPLGEKKVWGEGTFDIFQKDKDDYFWVSFHGYDFLRGYRGIAKTKDFVHWIAGDAAKGVPDDAIVDEIDGKDWREEWKPVHIDEKTTLEGPIGGGAGSILKDGDHYYLGIEIADLNLDCTPGQNWDWGLLRSRSLTQTNWEQYPLVNPILYSSKAADGVVGPVSIAVSPKGKHVYAAGYDNNAVAVYRGDAFKWVEMQQDGVGAVGLKQPLAITLSPYGENVYATSKGDSAVVVFARDMESGRLNFVQVLQDVHRFRYPGAIAVSPKDGNHVYVADRMTNALVGLRRDTASGRLSHPKTFVFSGVEEPASIVLSPDGRYLYVAAQSSGTVSVLMRDTISGDLSHVQTLSENLVGASSVTLSPPPGNHVYVASTSRTVSVFDRDLETGVLTHAQSLKDGEPVGARSIAASVHGTHVYVASSSSDALVAFMRDGKTGKLSRPQVLWDGGEDEEGQLVDGLDGVSSVAAAFNAIYATGRDDDAVARFGHKGTGPLIFIGAIRSDYVTECNLAYGQLFRDPDSRSVYFKIGRLTRDPEYNGIYVYKLVHSFNTLKNADLWRGDEEGWKSLAITEPAELNVYRFPNQSSDGNNFLAVRCGSEPCGQKGESVFQDVDVSTVGPRPWPFTFGGKFATGFGKGAIELGVHQLDSLGTIITSDFVTQQINSTYAELSGSAEIVRGTHTLRYEFSPKSTGPAIFRADEMQLNVPSVFKLETDTSWRAIAPVRLFDDLPIDAVGLLWEKANPGWNTDPNYDDAAPDWRNAVINASVHPPRPDIGFVWAEDPSQNGSDGKTPAYFRKEFTLEEMPKHARLTILTDDDAQVYINGAPPVSDDRSNSVRPVIYLNVKPYMRAGENLIAVKAHDSRGGQEGLYLTLRTGPQEIVNRSVKFSPDRKTYSFRSDAAGCPRGYAGKFTFTARLTNTLTDAVLNNLAVEVLRLTRRGLGSRPGEALLLTGKNSEVIGYGDAFPVPGDIGPQESADVDFTVCLQHRQPFSLAVNVIGNKQ